MSYIAHNTFHAAAAQDRIAIARRPMSAPRAGGDSGVSKMKAALLWECYLSGQMSETDIRHEAAANPFFAARVGWNN